MRLRLVPPGGGEVVGDSPSRRVEILSDHEALHATWSRFGAGRDGADLHVHRLHTDLFYVLGGELTLRLGPEGEEVPMPAGRLARMPPGVVHGFRNASDAEVRYLNLHAPGVGFADYMRATRDGRALSYDQYDPPPDGGRPTSDAVIGEPVADAESIRVREVAVDADGRRPQDDDRMWSYYVLEGALVVAAGDQEVAAPAGSWLQLARGEPHALSADGSTTARMLEVAV